MMTERLEGGCLCGRVRYTTGAPVATVICHCTHCQRATGSAFSVNLIVANGQFSLTGVTTSYPDSGDSGKPVHRHFCGHCGSSLFSVADGRPGFTILKAGTLDDTAAVSPATQIYRDSAQRWLPSFEGLTTFPRART